MCSLCGAREELGPRYWFVEVCVLPCDGGGHSNMEMVLQSVLKNAS